MRSRASKAAELRLGQLNQRVLRVHQGCIKLGFALASAAARAVFASLSGGQPNPEGWQMLAGGRFGAAVETTTGHALRRGLHPGGCQKRAYANKTILFPLTTKDRLAGALAPILAGLCPCGPFASPSLVWPPFTAELAPVGVSPPTTVCSNYSGPPPLAEAGIAPASMSKIEGSTLGFAFWPAR